MNIRLADPGLPVHPFTRLQAIGFRRNGAPIWPVKGGSGEGDDGSGDDGDGGGDDDADQLGDAGKKALDAMKGKWQRERDAAKPWKTLAREHGVSTPEELLAKLSGKKDDHQQADADKIRREAATEATAAANRRIVRAEVKAAAAGKFADPADAIAFLDLDEFEVDDEGEVDADAITAALTELLTKKPHLAAQGGRRFQGGGDGGHRGGSTKESTPGLGRLRDAYAQTNK
ncbi:hypothetical protein [Actinoplanes rectilineatus]|uniref:hypothetical protein n=1 Tax=Actinoplanes rectilineatus TaxID=113571 RepID=UPI0005F2804B|nr:hypothetical protein [Actinoplanes rectilineatus]